MLIVERSSFIAWTQGILLDFSMGRGIVGDSADNEEAEKAVRRGERVGLTINGRLHSVIQQDGEKFVEKKIAGGV